MNVKSYHEWQTGSHGIPEAVDTRIKAVYSFEEIGDALVEAGLTDYVTKVSRKIQQYANKVQKAKEDMQSKTEKAQEASRKARNFKARAAKSKDPETQKISLNRSNEELMRQKILAAEVKVLQMKQTMAQSQLKTAEMRKARAEKR